MKKYGFILLVMSLICINSHFVFAINADELRQYPTCKYCGMDRQKNSISRMLVTYTDGTAAGTCSIHCMALEFATNMDKIPKTIQVADYNKLKLIDAEKAFWTIGGNMPGVMTKTGKWAFENKSDAQAFLQTNAGKLTTFEDAMKATFADMYSDTQMIHQKRKMMMKSNENKTP